MKGSLCIFIVNRLYDIKKKDSELCIKEFIFLHEIQSFFFSSSFFFFLFSFFFTILYAIILNSSKSDMARILKPDSEKKDYQCHVNLFIEWQLLLKFGNSSFSQNFDIPVA